MPAPLLRDPDFRRLLAAGAIGHFVRWLEVVVFGILAYERTASAFTVAGVLMLRLLPLALFGVPFGALAARVGRRAALLAMYAALAGTAIALLAIAASGRLEVWHLALASFVSGTAWAADNPLRRAPMGEIAGPERMGTAMALDAGASNASRLAGPAAGGVLLAQLGMVGVMLPVVVLYGVAIAAMLRLSPPYSGRPPAAGSDAGPVLAVGLAMVRDNPRLAAVLWVTVLFNLFGWPVLSMVPVIGQDRLGLGAEGVGLLASSDGLGTLIGAVALATLAPLARPALYGRLYVGGVLLFLAMLPAFALATHPYVAAAALLLSGLGQSAFNVMQSTLVFVTAPPALRRQAMGVLTVCIGTGPIGFLALGWLAERIGAPWAALASTTAGLAALALTRRRWRRCWRELERDGPA